MSPPIKSSGPRTPTSLSMTDPYAPAKPKPTTGVPAPQDYRPKDADSYEPPKPFNYLTSPFAPNTGVQHIEGSLSPKADYKDLPQELKDKMAPEVWQALPQGQRSTLLASFQQFKKAGVWQYVDKVTGEKEKRERPMKVGGYETQVPGNSGAIQYTLNNTKAFTDTLIQQNPQFGVDGGIMGAMHKGQKSVRESGPQSTSLHISIGPGNKMDAHIDQVNPVDTPDHGKTNMNLAKGAEHWAHEVLPEMIRKLYGVAGVVIEPTLKTGSKDDPGAEFKVMAGFEFRGFSKSKAVIENTPREGSYNIPDQLIKNLSNNAELAKIDFPFPKGLTKDSAPDPRELAINIAMLAKQSIDAGDNRIRIDLPAYAGQKGYQTAASAEIGRITKMVIAEMKAQGIDTSGITGVTVTYGKRNAKDKFATEGETISL